MFSLSHWGMFLLPPGWGYFNANDGPVFFRGDVLGGHAGGEFL